MVDIFATTKMNSRKRQISNRITAPLKIEKGNIMKMMEQLNSKQRQIVMHIYKCFKEEKFLPLKIFIHGSAGVGKSKVIDTLYQLLTNYFENTPGIQSDKEKMILTAYAGKAAY